MLNHDNQEIFSSYFPANDKRYKVQLFLRVKFRQIPTGHTKQIFTLNKPLFVSRKLFN